LNKKTNLFKLPSEIAADLRSASTTTEGLTIEGYLFKPYEQESGSPALYVCSEIEGMVRANWSLASFSAFFGKTCLTVAARSLDGAAKRIVDAYKEAQRKGETHGLPPDPGAKDLP
jgi:hypothetical protein